MLRHLLVEAGHYERLRFRRGNSGVAKVAIARELAVRLYWKLREAASRTPLLACRAARRILW